MPENFKNLSAQQIEELIKSSDLISEEEERMLKDKIEENERQKRERRIKNKPNYKLKRSPIEIINRLLFFIFIGNFLFSFVYIYNYNVWWFLLYIFSAFSCILYTPNRKSLKELIAAWPNIEDILKRSSLWKK
tara:strand:+ start:2425 stop:2823 length:399 start_codon:yes stop_codon:yes gene_type:complete